MRHLAKALLALCALAFAPISNAFIEFTTDKIVHGDSRSTITQNIKVTLPQSPRKSDCSQIELSLSLSPSPRSENTKNHKSVIHPNCRELSNNNRTFEFTHTRDFDPNRFGGTIYLFGFVREFSYLDQTKSGFVYSRSRGTHNNNRVPITSIPIKFEMPAREVAGATVDSELNVPIAHVAVDVVKVVGKNIYIQFGGQASAVDKIYQPVVLVYGPTGKLDFIDPKISIRPGETSEFKTRGHLIRHYHGDYKAWLSGYKTMTEIVFNPSLNVLPTPHVEGEPAGDREEPEVMASPDGGGVDEGGSIDTESEFSVDWSGVGSQLTLKPNQSIPLSVKVSGPIRCNAKGRISDVVDYRLTSTVAGSIFGTGTIKTLRPDDEGTAIINFEINAVNPTPWRDGYRTSTLKIIASNSRGECYADTHNVDVYVVAKQITGVIEHVPEQIDTNNQMKLLVSLDDPIGELDPTPGNQYRPDNRKIRVVATPSSDDLNIVSTDVMVFSNDNKYRVIEVSYKGSVKAGKLGHVKLEIHPNDIGGYKASSVEVDVVIPYKTCVESDATGCLYSDHLMVSSPRNNGAKRDDPDYHSIDPHSFGVMVGDGYETTLIFDCLHGGGCSGKQDQYGTQLVPVLLCNVIGGLHLDRSNPSNHVYLGSISPVKSHTVKLTGRVGELSKGQCMGWSDHPYKVRAIITRTAQ